MSIDKPEISAIELPRTELIVDYRPSDGAIIVKVAGEEMLSLFPSGVMLPTDYNSLKKFYEVIQPDVKALHDWMVRLHEENAKAGASVNKYVGLRCNFEAARDVDKYHGDPYCFFAITAPKHPEPKTSKEDDTPCPASRGEKGDPQLQERGGGQGVAKINNVYRWIRRRLKG